MYLTNENTLKKETEGQLGATYLLYKLSYQKGTLRRNYEKAGNGVNIGLGISQRSYIDARKSMQGGLCELKTESLYIRRLETNF